MRPLVEVKAGAAATSGSHIRDRVLRQAGRLDPAIEMLTDDLRADQALRERRTRADPDVGLRARRHPYLGWARLDHSVCGSFRPLEMAVDR